jgi:parvulin-like peptidyl-prolyl isomerase
MKPTRISLALLGTALALVLGATACGGSGGSVPSGAVAVVNGTEIPRSDLDALIARARKGYAAQKTPFPKEGTQEFQSVQAVYLNYLVQKAEFEQQAKDLGVTVSDREVDKALASFVKQHYPGKPAQFKKDLAAQGLTLASFRDTLRVSVLSQKLFDQVTKKVTVSPQETLAYFSQNGSRFGSEPSRQVRHILIQVKRKNGQIDYPKSKTEAERIYSQLKAGADFATLAKKYSADPGTKNLGGKITDTKGQGFAPEFEQTAFALKTGEISQPVKTQFGYHVIQALAPVKPGTPFKQVQASIKATLLQSKRNQVMTQWVQDLTDRYKKKVKYAAGFSPPSIPTTTDTTTATQ